MVDRVEIGKAYAIAARIRGWSNYSYEQIRGVAVREVKNSNPQAWIFQVEGGRKIQRSCWGISTSWERWEADKQAQKEVDERAAEKAKPLEQRCSVVSDAMEEITGVRPTYYVTGATIDHDPDPSLAWHIPLSVIERLLREGRIK